MALSRQSQGFTMEQIATQLGVSKAIISGDLVNCLTTKQSKPAKTASNLNDDHDRRRRREMT